MAHKPQVTQQSAKHTTDYSSDYTYFESCLVGTIVPAVEVDTAVPWEPLAPRALQNTDPSQRAWTPIYELQNDIPNHELNTPTSLQTLQQTHLTVHVQHTAKSVHVYCKHMCTSCTAKISPITNSSVGNLPPGYRGRRPSAT